MNTIESFLVNIGGTHEGHRGQYAELFARIINSRETPLRVSVVFSKMPVVFSMIEESFSLYSVVCLVRSCLGRKTAGILFRPLPAVRAETLKLKVKRAVLSVLNKLPNVMTLTIMPFDVEPSFSTIARTWIYDPQFWDQHFGTAALGGVPCSNLAATISTRAGDRKIVCAIGRQDRDKGFLQFLRLYNGRPDLRENFLFVSCGKVASEFVHLISRFEDAGGLVYNRLITDQEIFELYAVSDLIWCCYDVQYDQASGIFGRAMQFGVPVILRDQSLIHKFAAQCGVKYIACAEPIEATDLTRSLEREPQEETRARGLAMADLSIGTLRRALGLKPYRTGAEGAQL